MKGYVISLLAMLFCITGAIAQDKGYKTGWYGPVNQHPVVKINKRTSDSVSLVSSSFFHTTIKNSSWREKDRIMCDVGLSVHRTGFGAPTYYLELCLQSSYLSYLSVLKDSPLLIKLADDSVIRLTCNGDAVDKIGEVMSVRFNVIRYTVIPSYAISPEDIDKFANGIKKIRFEANNEKWDMHFYRYKKDEVGNFLYQAKSVITEALNRQTDFEEDF